MDELYTGFSAGFYDLSCNRVRDSVGISFDFEGVKLSNS